MWNTFQTHFGMETKHLQKVVDIKQNICLNWTYKKDNSFLFYVNFNNISEYPVECYCPKDMFCLIITKRFFFVCYHTFKTLKQTVQKYSGGIFKWKVPWNYKKVKRRTFTIHMTAGEGGGYLFTSLYHFHLLHRSSEISRAITSESSPFHTANSPTGTWNLWFRSASRQPVTQIFKQF